MTYTVEPAPAGYRCHDCGGEATIVLVADAPERDTGYVDEISLCEDCAQDRQENAEE